MNEKDIFSSQPVVSNEQIELKLILFIDILY